MRSRLRSRTSWSWRLRFSRQPRRRRTSPKAFRRFSRSGSRISAAGRTVPPRREEDLLPHRLDVSSERYSTPERPKVLARRRILGRSSLDVGRTIHGPRCQTPRGSSVSNLAWPDVAHSSMSISVLRDAKTGPAGDELRHSWHMYPLTEHGV